MPKANSTIGEHGIFATRLRGLMDKQNTTHQELADMLGVSRQAVSWYYFGKRQPNFEKLIEISEFFDVSTDYLLGVSEFKNYEEIKKINKNAEIFNQIEAPQMLESAKGVFNALADIGKNAGQQSSAFAHCLGDVVDSIREISSAYNSSVEKVEDYVKFLEFKTFSTEKIDSMQESVKAMANELANRIKINLEPDGK